MWDMVLFQKEKDDDRVIDYSIEIFSQEKDDKDMDAIDKKFKPQKKALREIDIELKTTSRDVKKRIKEIKNTNYRNTLEGEAKMFDIYLKTLDSRIGIQKELNNVEKTVIDLRIKLGKENGNDDLVNGVNNANKILGLSMMTGNGMSNASAGYDVINPLNNGSNGRKVGETLFSTETKNMRPPMEINTEKDIITQDFSNINESAIIEPNNNIEENKTMINPMAEPIDMSDILNGNMAEEKMGFTDPEYALMNLKNRGKGKDLVEVIHYVKEKDLFWIENEDRNGNKVEGRAKHIAVVSDAEFDFKNMAAEDKMGDKYKVVYDKVENMPPSVLKQWHEFSTKLQGSDDDEDKKRI